MSDKTLLRFMTCGSVDDGKSTLIGRLLFEGKTLTDDQMQVLHDDSHEFGTDGKGVDYALLVDGLESEREQGITIDVAYRYFSTEKRKFIVADTPGHEQYTRNMATAASHSDLAIVLIDARKGIVTQTKRHTHIAAILGIKHIIFAVNKMDMVDYDEDTFRTIENDYKQFIADMGFETIVGVPVSGRHGDHIIQKSGNMTWFDGAPLMHVLNNVNVNTTEQFNAPMRFPIQSVDRSGVGDRSYRGTLASGRLQTGDAVLDVSSGQVAHIKTIISPNGNVTEACAGDAIHIIVDRDVDLSRGHVLSHDQDLPILANQINADIIWFDQADGYLGRHYIIQTANNQTTGHITNIDCKIDMNSMEKSSTQSLCTNDIALCELSFQHPISMDPYAVNKVTGAFIIIDPVSNNTIGAGMVKRCRNKHRYLQWHDTDVTPQKRADIKNQMPVVLWFTGYLGAGKSDICNALEQSMFMDGRHTTILNGDNIRHGLCQDLGFSPTDRIENIRRVAQVAHLMADSGLIVLCSFVSPYALDRAMARDIIGDRFIEIYVDTPLDICMKNDGTGLYERALNGEMAEMTGVNSPYEIPENPDIHIKPSTQSMDEIVEVINTYLESLK